ncbi:hypothetical protein Pint_17138 [Pistacia integerrima]|uniref:Uncharacterized protein n=1 Tax=Pistacia integerrima TaxID=434235 RepID=A0ACC0YWK0_9ROSI|nr:hypothetical protein Pint_17138 [Pistacia integerrima]
MSLFSLLLLDVLRQTCFLQISDVFLLFNKLISLSFFLIAIWSSSYL